MKKDPRAGLKVLPRGGDPFRTDPRLLPDLLRMMQSSATY